MAVIEEKNIIHASPVQAQPLAAGAEDLPEIPAPVHQPPAEWNQALPDDLKKKLDNRPKTIGEKIFNRGVYTGIGWGANEVGSMYFTGMFERGPGKYLGKEGFERASQWMVKAFRMKDKPHGGGIVPAHDSAKNLLMWASLNFIGCFVVPAIKIMDGHKGEIVKKLNHAFDNNGKSEAEIAARDKEVAEAIACEPTQSWTTLALGRAAAMTAAIGIGHGVLQKRGNQWMKEKFDGAASGIAKSVGMGHLAAGDRTLPNDRLSPFHYYAQLAGPETLGCATSSVTLELASKYFSKKWPRVKDPKICAEVVAREEAAKATRGAHTAKLAAETKETLQPGLG